MRLIRAARFAGVVLLIALIAGLGWMRPGLAVADPWPDRQGWLEAHTLLWRTGGWLALLAIFAWMVFLVALMYHYLPMHRVATHLQTGLMIMGALLLVVGVLVWVGVLPHVDDLDLAQTVDRLALSLVGAGLFMAGGVTAWVAVDLGMLEKLSWGWLWPGILAGAAALPSPFLLPQGRHLILALALLILWCGVFGLRRTLPLAYPEL